MGLFFKLFAENYMKMKEIGPRGPRPWRPPPPFASANSCMNVTDIVQTVRLPFPARARSHVAIFSFATAINFIAWKGLCGGLYNCLDRVFANRHNWQ